MTPPDHHCSELRGSETCCLAETDIGPVHIHSSGAGMPVLFLHGFPEDGLVWRPLAERLDGRFRAVMPDLPGFGLSAATCAADPHETAKALAACLDVMDIDRFHLVAHDIGGVLAWAVASLLEKRLCSMVLLAAPHPADFIRCIWQDAPHLRRPYLDMLASERPLDESFAPEALVQFVGSPSPTERRRLEASIGRLNWDIVRRYYRWLTVDNGMDYWQGLQAPACPILAITGQLDPFVPLQAFAATASRDLPSFNLDIVEGAGHFLHITHPEKISSKLAKWLDCPASGKAD